MSPPSSRCLGPTRRSFLELGAYSLCGLGLGNSAKAAKTNDKEDPAVIFVWLPGGPSHMEMYDMKPDAPPSTVESFLRSELIIQTFRFVN